MTTRKVVVLAHGHCFDGLVSAAMFTHLRTTLATRPLRFKYRSCGYSPNLKDIPDGWLSGDENAIVDFRYTENSKLGWYFDHHPTAFASDEQREAALASPRRFFFDPSYGSCTKLIADIGRSRFGVDFSRFEELVVWADRIDSASFASADEAIDRSRPVSRLAAVVEHHGTADLLEHLVPALIERDVEAVADDAYVTERWRPLAAEHEQTLRLVKERAQLLGDVVYVEMTDASLTASAKFVAYALFPACTYSVSLLRMKRHLKLTVGYNPWSPTPRRHDIAAICQRHGGGGHAVVGVVSLPFSDLERAKELVGSFVAELNG